MQPSILRAIDLGKLRIALSLVTVGVSLLLALSIAGSASAQLANRRDTLRGHQRVFVSVTTPQSDDAVRQLGLVKASLERFIIARLTQANIPATTEFTDQTLILEIQVDTHKVLRAQETDVFAFVSRFEAIQAVRLATNRQPALAATWRATQFGAVTAEQAGLIRDGVIKNVDDFIRDWQAAQAMGE
jgi:hypothetical protein